MSSFFLTFNFAKLIIYVSEKSLQLTAKHDAVIYITHVMCILSHLLPYSEAAGKKETPKYLADSWE